MKELTHAQVQKARRRESKKNAIARYKSFKLDNPVAFNEQRNIMIGALIDLVTKTKYPMFQAKFILG
jgi:hypothetical protein